MELKRLITHFTYRIEAKPGGGFIAQPVDPAVAPLEAPTREELNRKIQEKICEGLAAQFPGLKLPLQSQDDLTLAFHIEHKPEGGFVIHSADPKAEPIEVLTHNDVQSHFAEKLIGFMGKHLTPELSQALAAQGNAADVQVLVNRQTGLTFNTGSHSLSLSLGRNVAPTTAISKEANQDDARIEDAKLAEAKFGNLGGAISNAPIVPEASSSGKFFRFAMMLLIAAAIIYFFFHYR